MVWDFIVENSSPLMELEAPRGIHKEIDPVSRRSSVFARPFPSKIIEFFDTFYFYVFYQFLLKLCLFQKNA
jgi:hypothetical protein